jgi:hypothetical protein
MADEFFLSRWSRRKTLARQGAPIEQPPAAAPETEGTPSTPAAPAGTQAASAIPAEPAPLPPVESLTADSDFSPFMKPEVDPALRRQALRKLLHDPRFNVMDGLDVYIDDFSKPDPLPPDWLGKMNQMARLGEYREPEPDSATAEGETGEAAQVAEVSAEASGEPPAEPAETVASDTSRTPDRAPEVDDSSPSPAAS